MRVTPVALSPHFKPVEWGGHHLREVFGDACPEGPVGEAWAVSARDGAQSVATADGRPLAEIVDADPRRWLGTAVVADTGREFPLLVKFLDAASNLSMQVHPDRRAARRLGGDARPKTECWWVLDAEPGAKLWLGIADDVDDDAFRAAVEAGDVESVVQAHEVHAGDVFFVPSGAVHAIGAGIRLLEIQETSDTTFRLHDWGRVGADGQPRTLHVAEALEAARRRPGGAGPVEPRPYPGLAYERDILVDCGLFTLERLRFDDRVLGRTDGRRFQLVTVLDGTIEIEADGRTYGPFGRWACVLLPAALGEFRLRATDGPVTLALAAPGSGPLYRPPSDLVRLQKVLAESGVGSRRECEGFIAEGRVTVDGDVVDTLGTKVDPGADIRLDGERIGGAQRHVYYLLNKPRGVVCTNRDDQSDRPRAIDFIRGGGQRIYTIGRLDVDSEGVILLTNDGEFAFRVSHPSFGIPKVYLVQVRGQVVPEHVRTLERGVFLSDGRTGGFAVQIRRVQRGTTWLRVTLRQGKNREIRRAFAKLGYPVKTLKRVRIGNLTSYNLPVGKARVLSPREVDGLLAMEHAPIDKLPPDADDAHLPKMPKRTRGRRGPAGRRDTQRDGRRDKPRERRSGRRRR